MKCKHRCHVSYFDFSEEDLEEIHEEIHESDDDWRMAQVQGEVAEETYRLFKEHSNRKAIVSV